MALEQPEAEFDLWCNYSKHVLEIFFGNSSDEDPALKSVRKMARETGSRSVRKVSLGPKAVLMVMTCPCSESKPTTWTIIENHNCLNLQPTVFKGEWESYRMLAFRRSDFQSLIGELSKLGKLEIQSQKSSSELSMRENFVLSTDDLFGDMTEKQSEALLAALRFGYYKVPRKISTNEIARKLGRAGTTYREHLLKGERKLIRSVEPYLELRKQS